MNVLALYDIHGNIDALDAVLADPRAADPDAVLVGGDAVPGPFARADARPAGRARRPVHWIRGNGEREVAEAVGAPEPAARRPRRASPPTLSARRARAPSGAGRSVSSR